jgi:hypothetical protein
MNVALMSAHAEKAGNLPEIWMIFPKNWKTCSFLLIQEFNNPSLLSKLEYLTGTGIALACFQIMVSCVFWLVEVKCMIWLPCGKLGRGWRKGFIWHLAESA